MGIKLSVILAINNDNPFWERSFESVFEQSFKDFEFITVFNGKDENLWQKLQKVTDPRFRLHRTGIKQLSFNLNYALNIAQGTYIARMDADDLSHPDRFKIMLSFLEANPTVDVLGCGYKIINEDGQQIGERVNPETNRDIRRKLPYSNPFAHPSVLYKKESIINSNSYLGGKNSEDYSLWLRMARNENFVFHNISDLLLSYRIHSAQNSRNLIAYAEAASLVLCEFLISKKIRYFFGSIVSIAKVFVIKYRRP